MAWKAFDAANAHIRVNWIPAFSRVSTFPVAVSELQISAEHVFIILELQ